MLTHAICDAILGAICGGDIGDHFPDNDPAFKDADSLKLLDAVMAKAAEKNMDVVHVDATVIAQKPKIFSV